MSSLTAPPLWNVAWGLFFHPTSATLSFLMTTSVPFAGSGTTASFVKLAFACLSVCAVLNHVYHLLVPLGISLEVQDTMFISGVALGVLPSLICVSRCFFLELPRKQAVLLTVLNVFIVTVWPVLTKNAFGLPEEQPTSVLGIPEYIDAQGWKAPTQHLATELGIISVTIGSYLAMAPAIKAKKA